MGEKILIFAVFLVFGVFGREMYSAFGSIPYFILFLLTIRYNNLKEIGLINFSLLFFINLLNIYYANTFPFIGILNVSIITLSVFPFVYLRDAQKITLSPIVVAGILLIVALYKEVEFQRVGASMHFSLDSIRRIGNIRQSSDTIVVLSVLYLISRFNELKNWKQIPFYLVTDTYAVFILLRYDVRTGIFALIVSLFYRQIAKNIKIIAAASLIAITCIVVYDYHIEIWNYFLKNENIIWRLSMWIDFLNVEFSPLQLLFGRHDKNVAYQLTTALGYEGYVNPHNSYILILHSFGLVYLAVYLSILYRVLYKGSDNKYKQIFFFLVLMAFTTPVFELPYIVVTFGYFYKRNR